MWTVPLAITATRMENPCVRALHKQKARGKFMAKVFDKESSRTVFISFTRLNQQPNYLLRRSGYEEPYIPFRICARRLFFVGKQQSLCTGTRAARLCHRNLENPHA
jgi:hypothetical protein